MGFARVDGYLLGDPISKADAVAEFLANRSPDPAAAPFYRALEAVGARAADEALIALRLVLAKREPNDAGVKRLRALAAAARAATGSDRDAARAAYARELAQEA
jgi:hypothetical protein